MFDKNNFKVAFRSWAQKNLQASEDDALAFCHQLIPARHAVSQHWLVDQSLQWFKWLKSRQDNVRDWGEDDDVNDYNGHADSERIVS